MVAAYLQARLRTLGAPLASVPAMTGLTDVPHVVDRLRAVLRGEVTDLALIDRIRATPLLAGPLFRDVADATLHRALRGQVPFHPFARAAFPLVFPPREDVILPLGKRFFTDVEVVQGSPVDVERVMWSGPYGMPSHLVSYDSADVLPPRGWSVWCDLDGVPEGPFTWLQDAYQMVRDVREATDDTTPDAFAARAIFDGVMEPDPLRPVPTDDVGWADVLAAAHVLHERVVSVRKSGAPRPDVVRPGQDFAPSVWIEHDGVIPSAFHVAAWCDTIEGRSVPMPKGEADAVVDAVLTSAQYAHVRTGPHGQIARLHLCTSPTQARTYDVWKGAWTGEQTWLPGPMCGRVEVG